MQLSEAHYLWRQILQHTKRFFTPEAVEMLNAVKVRFLSYGEAVALHEPALAIPIDIDAPVCPEGPYRVPFNNTKLTLWNPLPLPREEGWACLPSNDAPLWYRHDLGTLIPTWNVFAHLFDLLTLREEIKNPLRDTHGRFTGAMSPRREAGLLAVPAFNEGVAALVAACSGLFKHNYPRFDLEGLVKPPVLVLSHDNDILRGNDIWTQSVRFCRIFQPLLHFKAPRCMNAWWMLRNAVYPKAYYLDNLAGMVDVERMLGYTSTFYFLNGSGGRFGARSGSALILEALSQIPADSPVGVHYNYDTLLDAEKFNTQLAALSAYLSKPISAGRAHYLRFDPEKSFSFFADSGIKCDESVGYPDCIGYRCGIAGAFQPYDHLTGRALSLLEVPLTIIESTLVDQYPREPVKVFNQLLTHISRIGGAVSLLFHPGLFFNPEFPETRGLYRCLLGVARQLSAQSSPGLELDI